MDTEHEITIGVKEENGKWKLETNVYDYLPQNACAVISTETLGMAFEPEQKYENPDGTPIVFRYDVRAFIRCRARLHQKRLRKKHYHKEIL